MSCSSSSASEPKCPSSLPMAGCCAVLLSLASRRDRCRMPRMSLLFWEVQQEHLDGAAFLFTRWEHALRSPLLTLREVATGVEERLLAHVDGLVLGGEPV